MADEKTNGWYHIQSSFGDGWILVDRAANAPANYVATLPQKTDKVIDLKTETTLYTSPVTAEWLAKLSPQQVQAVEVWNNNWYKIHTWLGDTWIAVEGE